MAKEIDPKKFLLKAAANSQEGLDLIIRLDENRVSLKDIEKIQKRMSDAATEMTKLKTWMLENLPPVKDEDDH